MIKKNSKLIIYFSNDILNRNCGQLRMAQFPSVYAIPNDIKALVRGEEGAANFLDMMLQSAPVRARSKPETYHLSNTTKLFLEEEAGLSKNFDQYHMNDVWIEHFNNDIFRFKIDVSIKFYPLIYSK